MTANLPVSYLEAEAEQFARHWFARLGEGSFLDTGHPFLDPAAAHVFVRQLIKAYAEAHPRNATKIVEWADRGSDEAREVLRDMMAEKNDNHEPLGAVLGAYNIRLMDGLQDRGGRSKVPFHFQDIAISMCALQLIERFPGLKRRRRQKRRECAYSIIAKVTADMHLQRGDEEAIRKVCERYLPILTFGYQWPDWGRGAAI